MGVKRFGIKALGRCVDVAKVRDAPRGDTYIIFPILQTGLHVSFHPPRPERGLPATINVKDQDTEYGTVRSDRFLQEEVPVEEAVQSVDHPGPGEEFIFVDIGRTKRFLLQDGESYYIDVDSFLAQPPLGALERVPGRYLQEYTLQRDLTRRAAFDSQSGDVIIPIMNREEPAVLRLAPDLDLREVFPGLPAAGEIVGFLDRALAETERRKRAGEEVLTPQIRRFMETTEEMERRVNEFGQRWQAEDISEFDPV